MHVVSRLVGMREHLGLPTCRLSGLVDEGPLVCVCMMSSPAASVSFTAYSRIANWTEGMKLETTRGRHKIVVVMSSNLVSFVHGFADRPVLSVCHPWSIGS